MGMMAINMAGSIAGHNAENAAVRDRNNAIAKNNYIQQREYDVKANLDNVQYLNDVQEKDVEDDRTYQAMLDTMSDTDFQMKSLFEDYDQQIEDANIEMAKKDYAGTQTGATAARLAAAPVVEKGRKMSRILHSKMRTITEANTAKERTHKKAVNKQWDLHMDVAFAPAHGFRPRDQAYERGRGKGLLMLELGQHALTGYSQLKANTAPRVTSGKPA